MKRARLALSEDIDIGDSSFFIPQVKIELDETPSGSGETSKSKYSQYFEFEILPNNERMAICMLCQSLNIQTFVKMAQSNTSGLKWHLKRKHPMELQLLFPGESQLRTSRPTQDKPTKPKAKANKVSGIKDEDIVKWISLKLLSFNFFEDPATQTFFGQINNKITFPTSTTLKEKVFITFTLEQQKVLEVLKNNSSKLSFSVDGWTKINNKTFYGITCHYIDHDWKLQSLLIDLLPFNGKQTGKDIAKLLYKIAQENGIVEKIQGITIDDSTANTSFIQDLNILIKSDYPEHLFGEGDSHFRCFAHILKMGMEDMLKMLNLQTEPSDNEEKDVQVVLNKVRALFKKIVKNEHLQNLLKTLCDVANIKYVSVNIETSTEWSSTCDILNRASTLKNALISLIQTNDCLMRNTITEEQWRLIDIVAKFLKYFKNLTHTLSGEHPITLPLLIVPFNIFLDKLQTFLCEIFKSSANNTLENKLLQTMQEGQEKMLEAYTQTNWMYCAALVLDPRHKIETFALTSWGKELQEKCLKKVENFFYVNYIKPCTTVAPQETEQHDENSSSSSDEALWTLFKKSGPKDLTEAAKMELQRYTAEERVGRNVYILNWWKDHQEIYPSLAKMARDFLAMPSTSVHGERLFSTKASLEVRQQQSRLDEESARTLLCLNSWYNSTILNGSLTT